MLPVICLVEIYNPESAVQPVTLSDDCDILDELKKGLDVVAASVIQILRVQQEDNKVLCSNLELGLGHQGCEVNALSVEEVLQKQALLASILDRP